jgi:hypothetical protein
MKNQRVIANSLLWAAAIVAAAITKAPPVLTLILLPCLATGFVLVAAGAATRPGAGARR